MKNAMVIREEVVNNYRITLSYFNKKWHIAEFLSGKNIAQNKDIPTYDQAVEMFHRLLEEAFYAINP